MTEHEKLKHAPLVLVVAQINFSPVEDIETHIPAIQTKFKEQGYPYFNDKSPLQEITVTQGVGIQINGTKQWFFIDKKKKTGIALTKNMLVLNCADYTTFRAFLPVFENVLKVIADELSLEKYNALEHVSLRYVDHVRPIGGKSPEELIKAEFLGGFHHDDDVQLRQVLIERKTDVGIARFVVFKPFESQTVLADIQATQLDFGNIEKESPCIVLDMAHTKKMSGEDFNQSRIMETLGHLHQEVDDFFFKQIPTAEALELWKGK